MPVGQRPELFGRRRVLARVQRVRWRRTEIRSTAWRVEGKIFERTAEKTGSCTLGRGAVAASAGGVRATRDPTTVSADLEATDLISHLAAPDNANPWMRSLGGRSFSFAEDRDGRALAPAQQQLARRRLDSDHRITTEESTALRRHRSDRASARVGNLARRV